MNNFVSLMGNRQIEDQGFEVSNMKDVSPWESLVGNTWAKMQLPPATDEMVWEEWRSRIQTRSSIQ